MGASQSSRKDPPPRLDDDTAFAIATLWRDDLRGCVQLDTHDSYSREPVAFVEAKHSVVRHFEWVSFSDSIGALRFDGSAAHASVIVWLALAHCVGFSGRENPHFWKRVFSVLWSAPGQPPREIADDVRFFEHTERPFPCVRLVVNGWEEGKMLRAFFRAGVHDRKLRRALQRLKQHIADPDWWRHEIPVEIVGVELRRIAHVRPEGFLPERHRTSSARKPSPRFRLDAVRTSTSSQIIREAAFLSIASDFSDVAVHIPVAVLAAGPGKSVFQLAHERPHEAHRLFIETIQPRPINRGDLTAFPTMCSALPQSRIVTAFMVNEWDKLKELDDESAAWLGYALFHPDTATMSSLTALSLCLPYRRPTAMDVLSQMARGNNLLLALGKASTPSSAYFEAQLAASTDIYAESSTASPVVYSCSSELAVTLCIASVTELDGASWVCVVVPGFGIGWVQRGQVSSVVSRAPGTASLRRLALSGYSYQEYANRQTLVPQLLSLLGASLTHLRIEIDLPAREVRAVLRSCPNLQALRVHNDGVTWSDSIAILLTPQIPRLLTLELVISLMFYSFTAPQLDDLTCLRLIDNKRDISSLYRRSEVRRLLKRYPRLSHVYWSSQYCNPLPWWEASRYRPWWKPTVGSDLREWQSTSYGLLGEDVAGSLDTARVPLLPYARLAFLSVCNSSAPGSLPRLSSEIVRQIFAFGSMEVPRQLLVRYFATDPID